MKILHVITSMLPGGAEKLLTDLLPRFQAMGIEAEVAVYNAQSTALMQKLGSDNVRVHRFYDGWRNVYSPKNLLKLRALVGRGGYDIVHTHNSACQLHGALVHVPKGTLRVTTEHNTDNRRRRFSLLRFSERRIYARYSRIVCISDGTLQALTCFLGAEVGGRCVVIPNGVDISQYSSDFRCPDPDGAFTITMVAGFRPQKDQDTAVRALALLPERFRLVLVGDGVRQSAVKDLAEDLGVSARVEFAGIRSDVPELLRASDVVLMSSRYEGLSLSSVEGMASGRPFVASDVDGLHEVVEGAGLLFPQGDASALASVIERLSSDESLYRLTADKCRQRAGEFDISVAASRYVSLYSSLMADK